MSEILKVLNKKVELRSEVVELGIVDDFEKVFKSAVDKDLGIGTTLISALGKAENAYKKIQADYKNAEKLGEDAVSKAKALGVDLPKTVTNKILSAKAGIKESQMLIGKINSLYSAF